METKQSYYERNKEYLKEYQRKRWASVIEKRWYKRSRCADPVMSESYRKRNATRYVKNKTTWRNKEIIKKQNEWIKKQYEMYT